MPTRVRREEARDDGSLLVPGREGVPAAALRPPSVSGRRCEARVRQRERLSTVSCHLRELPTGRVSSAEHALM